MATVAAFIFLAVKGINDQVFCLRGYFSLVLHRTLQNGTVLSEIYLGGSYDWSKGAAWMVCMDGVEEMGPFLSRIERRVQSGSMVTLSLFLLLFFRSVLECFGCLIYPIMAKMGA